VREGAAVTAGMGCPGGLGGRWETTDHPADLALALVSSRSLRAAADCV